MGRQWYETFRGEMIDFLPLMIAIAGTVLIVAVPLRHAGLTLALLLGGLMALTLFDLSTHRPTSSDIGGFGLALMVGGFALLARANMTDKE
jgi:hypothetical protein